VLGELSLLTGQPRSIGARARRDSELLRIARQDFEQLLETHHGFGSGLVRVLGERLRRARPPGPLPRAPRVIALVPLHGAVPLDHVATQLLAELSSFGSIVRLDDGDHAATGLDQLEAANR